jgi:gliding motility-associated-like protein
VIIIKTNYAPLLNIWFTITVPASGNVIINTDTGSLQNIAMAIYSAASCSGPLTEISCDENTAGNNMPQITLLGQTPGAVLYVRVWDIFEPGFFGIGVDPREQGDFQICFVAPPPAPFNDEPCQAITLVPGTSCNPIAGTNVDALSTQNIPDPGCGGTNPGVEDVWYVLQAPASGAVTISMTAGSLNNMAMAAYTAASCSNSLNLLDCNDGGTGMPSMSLQGLTPGQYIFIRVWDEFSAGFLGIGADPREQGTFSICAVETVPIGGGNGGNTGSYTCGSTPPAGNTCATATPICTFDGYCGSTAGYTDDYWFNGGQGLGGPLNANGIFCGSIENNSFISFIASSSVVDLDVIVSGGVSCDDGVQFMMFGDPSGAPACGSLNIVDYGCQSPMAPGTNNFQATGLTPGGQYYLMVDGFAGDVCDYQINAISGVLVGVSAGADRNICLGESVDLTVYGAGTGTVTWSGPFLSSTTGVTVTATPTAVGTYQYIVTAPNIDPACGGPTSQDTVVVTVGTASPVDVTAGPCVNGEVTLTATGGTTYTWDPPMDIGQTSGSTVVVSPSTTTTYTVYGASASGCVLSDTITIGPAGAATIAPATFCVTDAAASLTAVGTQGGTWSGPGITNTTTGLFNPSVAGVGTHTITYVTGGACGGTATETITVNAASNPTISPASFCVSATASNLVVSGATGGTWSGPGITDGVNGTFDPAVAGIGTHLVTYSITGSCGGVDTETITVTAGDQATINNATFCLADAATNLTVTGTQGGTWTGTGITNGTNGTFDPSVSGAGTHQVIYTTSGACATADTLDIIVSNTLTATINTQTFCAGDLAANLTVTGSAGGTWSGTGITDVNNGTFDPSVSGAGTYQVIYTLSGSCGSADTTDIVVTPNDQATINNATFCLADAATNLTVTGTQGGTWTGTGITNGTNGTFDPSVSGAGTHQVIYTTSGACATADTLDIIVSNTLSATINTQTFCAADLAANLTVTGSAGGTWSGTGITDVNNGTFDPSVSGAGTYQVIYTLSGSCGSADTTDIVVTPNDVASIDAASFCLAQSATNLTVTGTQGGTWSGTGITDANNGTFDPSVSGVGTHQVIYTTLGACATADTFDVLVNANATADIQEDTVCQGANSLNLTVTGTSGGTWSGTGITDVNNGTFDPSVSGTGSFEVIYTVTGACPVTDTSFIEVEAADQAVIDPQSFCVADVATNLTVTGTQGGAWSGTGIVNPLTGQFDPATAGVGSHDVIYTTTGNCPDSDTLTIEVTAAGQAAIQAQDFCPDAAATNLGLTGTTGGTWSGTGITDATNGTFDPSVSGSGTFTIYYATTGACAASDSVTIIVAESPTANPYINQQGNTLDSILLGNSANLFSGTNTSLSYSWTEVSGNGGLDDPSASNPVVTPTAEGTYVYLLNVVSTGGTALCVDSALVSLVVYSDASEPQIPTAFTPNGDQVNDVFQVIGLDPDYLLEFKIFNRWGVVVYDDVNGVWDGRYKEQAQPTDAYIYLISWQQPSDAEAVTVRGQLTLLR